MKDRKNVSHNLMEIRTALNVIDTTLAVVSAIPVGYEAGKAIRKGFEMAKQKWDN